MWWSRQIWTLGGMRTTRDPLLDLARTAALAVVVLWHWVFSTVEVNDTGLHVGSVLTAAPWLWPLTWILQPMAIFFAVGGSLHLASWRKDPERFVRRRGARLALPALPLLLPVMAIVLVAHLLGHPIIAGAGILIISPLWFLGVYLVLMALVPVTAPMHERHPALALAGLLGGAVAVDVARFRFGWEGPLQILVGFLVVWATVHQLGYWWERLTTAPVAARAGLAATGLAGLVLLPRIGPYPLPMVGVPGQEVSNMAPPNLMTVMLALFHVGALALVAAPLRRFADRQRARLATAQQWAMPVFVWHLAGYTAFFAAAVALLGLDNVAISGTWWSQRWLWLVGPTAATTLILVAIRRGGDVRTARRARALRGSPAPLG